MTIKRTQVNKALKALGLNGTGVTELHLDPHQIKVSRFKRDNNGMIALTYEHGANVTLETVIHDILPDR